MMDGTVQRDGLTGNGIDHAIQSEIDRDDSDSCRNDEQEHPHLRIEGFPDAAQKQQVVTAEIDGKKQHEHRHNGLQVVGIACHTVVPDAETAGSGGAEGSVQGIEHTHPTAEQEDKLNNCQRHVERVQNHGSGAHARHQLAHRGTGAFRLHDVHIPPAGEWNEANIFVKDGVITDENRIQGALPTIKYLMEHGAKVVLCSHMGKPHNVFDEKLELNKKEKAKIAALPESEQAAATAEALEKAKKDVKKLTLAPVAARLNELLGGKVTFAKDVIGNDAKAKVAALKDGECVLLENLRFHKGEEKKTPEFMNALASYAD